jgi:hypothetical protein
VDAIMAAGDACVARACGDFFDQRNACILLTHVQYTALCVLRSSLVLIAPSFAAGQLGAADVVIFLPAMIASHCVPLKAALAVHQVAV